MYRFLYFTVFFFVIVLSPIAQENLVPNGSFEEYYDCPAGGNLQLWAKNWYAPNFAIGDSPDYFNVCATDPQVGVPQNIRGYQVPKTGDAYAGFYARTNNNGREYLQVELKKELEAGKIYTVKFFLNLPEINAVSVWNIGAHLSNTAVSSPLIYNSVLNVTPQILNEEYNFLNWTDWKEINVMYEAQGGEKFITIGNFYTDANTDTLFIPGLIQFNPDNTYIYIDDVSITETLCEPIFPNVFTPNNDGLNEYWQPKKLCLFKDELANFIVYNRWGNNVYKALTNDVTWDGKTTRGTNVSEGIYYYIINTKIKTYKGMIQLLR